MSHPLVIAYHLVWTGYGWWLPNDPRGSGSTTIRNDLLAEFGDVHLGRKPIQPSFKEIHKFYEKTQQALQHPPLTFSEKICAVIAETFEQVINECNYTCYACAVMPDHVHILIRKHKHQVEEMAENLKAASRQCLMESNYCPPDHPVWTGGYTWNRFLELPREVRRTIKYIEQNPVKIGWPVQSWPFVKEYDDWPLHPGHSPNSPYAKALRAVGRYP